MATLHGIVIADPARKNVKFSNADRDQYDVSRKEPGRPLPQFVSTGNEFNNFPEYSSTPFTKYSIDETTIPMTATYNKEMIDLWRERKENLEADVEKPQLETDKYLEDQGMNKGPHFNPAGIYPTATFKQVSRPNYRTIRNPLSRFAQAHVYAKAAHYLYVDDRSNYRDVYYEDNPWKDSKGRIHLFDKPFTRIW